MTTGITATVPPRRVPADWSPLSGRRLQVGNYARVPPWGMTVVTAAGCDV